MNTNKLDKSFEEVEKAFNALQENYFKKWNASEYYDWLACVEKCADKMVQAACGLHIMADEMERDACRNN